MTALAGMRRKADVPVAGKARYALAAIHIANGALAVAGKPPPAGFFRGFGISYPGPLVLNNCPRFRSAFQRPDNDALLDLTAADIDRRPPHPWQPLRGAGAAFSRWPGSERS